MWSFARTKIQPPRQRPGLLLARPALEARLAQALTGRRLVLVCATAGYGKTSALARQIEALPAGTAVAWVSCDVGDSPLGLFQCLVSALEPYDPPWRTEPEALMATAAAEDAGPAQTRALRAMAAELINALDACDVPHGVIVVDDLHRVDHPTVFEFLDLLLERFTPRWTLAIASRHEPPIALARLRAQGEMAEFRIGDLRFDQSEAAALVAVSGLDTTAAEPLVERTQGWPVALRLALHVLASPRDGAAAAWAPAIDRPMFDFLAAEVIDRLPPAQREFLLLTSVLPELNPARCAALTGDPQAGLQLERLERAGLSVSTLPGPELTLRLHDLLRDALLLRLRRERPQAVAGQYARAAASEPDPGRRIDYLLHAGDHEEAARVLCAHAPTLLTSGAASTVVRLLEGFPSPWAQGAPRLAYVAGLVAWSRWDFAAMRSAMQRAEDGYMRAGDAGQALLALGYQAVALNALGESASISPRLLTLQGEGLALETRLIVLLARLWHTMDVGEMGAAGGLLDEMLDLLQTTDDLSLWYRAHPIPRLTGLPGTARALDRYVEGVMRLTGDVATPLRAMALSQRALAELWQGHAAAAAATAAAVQADAQWLGNPPNVHGVLQLVTMLLACVRGEREPALAAARRLVDDTSPRRGPWAMAGSLFYATRAAAAFDDLAALNDHLSRLEALREHVPPSMAIGLRSLRGLRAWLEGDHAAAVQAWGEALADEGHTDRLGSAIELRVRLAAAQARLGDDQAAIDTLTPAAQRVAAYAGLGGVLLARSALAELAVAAAQGRLGSRLQGTVAQWHRVAQACALEPDDPGTPRAAPDSGLSSRELDVLRLIAAGQSNKLIARAFDLSPHTVKRHVANILDKLDLRSRGQAAAWYHAQAGNPSH
jgi:LuxR family maltose regulon positive regulatory protein